MKISVPVAACVVGLLACIATYVWLASVARVWVDPFTFFMVADPFSKMAIILIVLALIAGLLIAVIGRASKMGQGLRGGMSLMAAVAAATGALGAVYVWANIQMTIQAMGGSVRLEVTAPVYCEAVISLGIGLAAALVILLLRPRRQTPKGPGVSAGASQIRD